MKAETRTNACAHYGRYFWDYPKMKSDEPLRLEIDSHLKTCEHCSILFERTLAIHQHLEYQKSLTTSSALLSQIMEKYSQRHATKIQFLNNLKPLAAAAIIVIMVGAGILSGRLIAGKLLPEPTVEISNPVQSLNGETFFTEADIFTPGYEFLKE